MSHEEEFPSQPPTPENAGPLHPQEPGGEGIEAEELHPPLEEAGGELARRRQIAREVVQALDESALPDLEARFELQDTRVHTGGIRSIRELAHDADFRGFRFAELFEVEPGDFGWNNWAELLIHEAGILDSGVRLRGALAGQDAALIAQLETEHKREVTVLAEIWRRRGTL
jgi:hypothetical protein